MKDIMYMEMCGEVVAVIIPVYRKIRIGRKFKWKHRLVFKPVNRFKDYLIEVGEDNEKV